MSEERKWEIEQRSYQDTLMAAASAGGADLVACSPPYCDARSYGADVIWTDADYAKPGGHALINVDSPVRRWRKGFGTERGFHPWRMMLDWADRVGFRVPDRLAFGRMGVPGEYAGRFRNDWEPLLWFQRPGADGFFDRWAVIEDSKSGAYLGQGGSHNSRKGLRVRKCSGDAAENGKKHRGTLWDYGSQGKGHTGCVELEAEKHPARWPFNLAYDLVRVFCPPHGLVVDPFVGAGTTALAAVISGRRFIGGDLFCNESGESWASVANRVLTNLYTEDDDWIWKGGMT